MTIARLSVAGLLAALVAGAGCGAVYTIGGASAGTAGGGCPEGRIDCDGVCIDPSADPLHCGACGRACGGGEVCVQGACEDPCDGACDEVLEVCEAGTCTCREGFVRCGGECVDPRTDGEHCGGCNVSCDGDRVCNDGSCVAGGCPTPLEECEGGCVDLQDDPLHCGGCERRCKAYEVCVEGTCRDTWPAPCSTCPCAACDDRVCCERPGEGVSCVDGSTCPGA
ncbi:MAG: hypothetical protein D6705_12825 [Deltaproteobacteria bacterium]|nr:MAG: hypothetical protein D6705_12825 [Deltaproteobacteria bacterium]